MAAPQAVTTVSLQQFMKRFVAAAIERTQHRVRYVSDYVRIPYPNGDVRQTRGFVPMRSFGPTVQWGFDLQKEVHEMVRNFSAYPNQKRWGLDHPVSNIDHRRVPNLMVFVQRKGESLPITDRAADYAPAISLHGIWAEVCRILASLWIRRHAGATNTEWCTTSEQDQEWRAFYLIGRLLATTAISGRTVPQETI